MGSTESNPTTPNEKREFWLLHIKQWEDSKLSQRAYCLHAEINYTTFVYWKSNLTAKVKDNQKKNFAPVKIISSSASHPDTPRSIQVKLVSGHVVYIPTTMDINEIAVLIHLLGNDNV